MSNYTRISRDADSLRDIKITPNFLPHADGSCLIECGNTKVICTASIDENVPPFLRGKGQGWVTAEYGMLPASTASRMRREAAAGKQSGRTQEIQRLIGRSLRAVVDMEKLSERQISVVGGAEMSEEELEAAGLNRSDVHVDFMIGSN